jgi:hypothetical protein
MAEGVTRDGLRSQSDRTSSRPSEVLDAEADLLGKRVAEFAWAGLRLVHRDS